MLSWGDIRPAFPSWQGIDQAHEEYQFLSLLTYNALNVVCRGFTARGEALRRGTRLIGTAEKYMQPALVQWCRPLKQVISFGAGNEASAPRRRKFLRNACHDRH